MRPVRRFAVWRPGAVRARTLPEEDDAAKFMFFFFDIFMAKISRFNELQAVIAGKILIPGNLRTKYLDCYTYGSFSPRELEKHIRQVRLEPPSGTTLTAFWALL